MQRLNLTIDENLYEQARAFSFLEKKPISQILRESLKEYFNNHEKKAQSELLLGSKDTAEVLAVLKNDEFASNDDFKKKFNL